MDKNFLERMNDSYDRLHFEDTKLKKGDKTFTISPKLKLIFGWSIFVLCLLLAYIFVLQPSSDKEGKHLTDADITEDEDVIEDVHKTTVPYEKDANNEINQLMMNYYMGITSCNHLMLQNIVTDPSIYSDNEALLKKAEFIKEYSNFTIYTKKGLDEDSYVVYVVSSVEISGVNSLLYDIQKFYVVNGARGYMINNSQLSEDVEQYIAQVTADEDIQEVFQAVKQKNEKIMKGDPSVEEQFYNVINKEKKNDETNDNSSDEG